MRVNIPPPTLIAPLPNPVINSNGIAAADNGAAPVPAAPAPLPAQDPAPEVNPAPGDLLTQIRAAPVPRNETLWIFVKRQEGSNYVTCLCGCMAKTGAGKLEYSAPNTGLVSAHLKVHHRDLLAEFQRCQNNDGDFNALKRKIETLDASLTEKIAKRIKKNDQFFSKALALPNAIAVDLRLTIWMVANAISRASINDCLFDSYLRTLGAPTAANRHVFQDTYLHALDDFVVEEMKARLAHVPCVSISSDGWRDRRRRDFIKVVLSWCDNISPDRWGIQVIEPDFIYVPSDTTAESIESLVNDSLNFIVRFSFTPLNVLSPFSP